MVLSMMAGSNLQRENILPSERAFAYTMEMEAMKRLCGRPLKEKGGQIGPPFFEGKIRDILATQIRIVLFSLPNTISHYKGEYYRRHFSWVSNHYICHSSHIISCQVLSFWQCLFNYIISKLNYIILGEMI